MDKVRQVKKYYAELDGYVANCLSDCMDQLCDADARIDELNNEL